MERNISAGFFYKVLAAGSDADIADGDADIADGDTSVGSAEEKTGHVVNTSPPGLGFSGKAG